MALIKCPDCGAEVSDMAPACIKCGCPLAKQIDKNASAPSTGKEFSAKREGTGILSKKKWLPWLLRVVIVLVLAIVVVFVFRLKKQEEKIQQPRVTTSAQQQQQVLSAAQRRQQEIGDLRIKVEAHPNNYLKGEIYEVYNKGIINDYCQLTSLRVINNSPFQLKDVSGRVEWFDENDNFLGSTSFSIAYTIAAEKNLFGGCFSVYSTKGRSLTSGTLQGKAKRAKIVFTNASIDDKTRPEDCPQQQYGE